MNKETFLQELRGYLQILEDQEQQDILDEYTQHIDMKIQKGLSEEEAIRDFGPVQELAAEILEAYHVKPAFGRPRPRIKAPDLTKATMEGRKVCCSAGSFVKQKVGAAGDSIQKGCRKLGEKVKGFWSRLKNFFCRKPKAESDSAVDCREKTNLVRKSGNVKKVLAAMGRGIVRMWKGLVCFCRWCLRLAWNVFWLCMSGVSGIFALLALFGFGAIIILRFQGYPLTGIVILCLGGILCFGAVCGGCFSLVIRKSRGNETIVTELAETDDREVQYE